jgi:hypothetical protein
MWQARRRCGDGLDVFLTNQLWRRCGTAHLAAPAQGGGTPVGPPGSADIVPQQEGCAPQLSRLQLPEGRCPRPTEGADRCSIDGGHLHGGEGP